MGISQDGVEASRTQGDAALDENHLLGLCPRPARPVAAINRLLVYADDDALRRNDCDRAGAQARRRQQRHQRYTANGSEDGSTRLRRRAHGLSPVQLVYAGRPHAQWTKLASRPEAARPW